LEDQGIVSDRITKNNLIDIVLNRDLKVIENECNDGNYSLLHYKIDTNNTCNATCITCDGASSSAWIGLEKQQGRLVNKPWNLLLDQIDLDYTNARSVNFRGGEPLLSRTNFEILKKLIEYGNTDCFISFTTNGSIRLNQEQIKILKNFSRLNFCLSIDGIDKTFEYLRYPLKWNTVLENIEQYRTNNIELSASFTLSNINMLYYSETVEWFNTNKIKYLNNSIYSPDYFRPTSLPKKIKNKISNSYNSIFISTHNENDDLLFEKFLSKIIEQDHLKNIRMQDFVPEFYNLIKNYTKE
jgi:MoaA/NifB/PqqE/SkfB family radical SAM enzyme